MTNSERIRSLSDKELAEYINSVYISGKFFEAHKNDSADLKGFDLSLVDYEAWLKEEAKNEEIQS